MKTKKLSLFANLYLGVIFVAGVLVVSYVLSIRSNINFNTLALTSVGGSLIGLLVPNIISLISKKNATNIPPIDERNVAILKRYFLIVLYIVLIGIGLGLFILYALGVKTVEVGALIVCLGAVYLLIVIGAFIVKRFC
ncbi:hypothetical protein [Clostridium manihotivorum]|uniref:Uncharacterized protein n=1 Tax=Clostridium manihotivorum TaxID=2320868 RepID=A0A3R5TD21_9CLOT|nr:hypothetical protein [Clostridium manihotivorum]QAA30513.1 hypothetical protein C1I91_01890 [Clostridium manihotivorum]